jgi:predicted nicotinamide N-methyase
MSKSLLFSFGPELNQPIVLNSGASHHMVNNAWFFNKIKEVNIEINTGNNKQRIKAVAMGEFLLKDNNGDLIKLTDVLFTPDLSRSLVSLNRLFSKKGQAKCTPNFYYMHSKILEWESVHSKKNGVKSGSLQKKWSRQLFTPKF